MALGSSLKRKSIFALAAYLVVTLTLVGSVTYSVVKKPVIEQLEQNLDLRTELMANQIGVSLNGSLGVLRSLVTIGGSDRTPEDLERVLSAMFSVLNEVTMSGGIWPKPFSLDPERKYFSFFYNRASDGAIDRIHSWDNPSNGGYDQQPWYRSVANKPPGTVAWSEVYIDPYTHVKMVTASMPYYKRGEFWGVATVDISLNDLMAFVKKNAEQYQLGVMLSDKNGALIIEHNYKLHHNAYIGKRTFGQFQWQVQVINANYRVSDAMFNLVGKVELGILPILLLCLVAGYWLINRTLISPITVISKQAQDSQEGGVVKLEYHGQDEIGQLVTSINQKTTFLEREKKKALASTKAKSAFLATLSHEIRTPMNGVLGTAQILLKTELSPEQAKHLKTLYESGEHMMTLLNEILDFSKVEQGHLELEKSPFALESILGSIHSVYYTLCAEKGLHFKIQSDITTRRWYSADKARIRQILFNLLNNAVKFTSEGEIVVTFNEVQTIEQTRLIIKVTDSGIGIAPSAQTKIFNPFEQAESSTTRQYGGTGLGLAIVKRLCELMGGTIELESELGKGSSFVVDVPIDITEPESFKAKVVHKLDCQGGRALIVEDNRTNAIILQTLLATKGFSCKCVEDGQAAVDEMSIGSYDVIFMDNHMPVMDGVESISQIRALHQRGANILIIGCTADVFQETQERMRKAGADCIIPKPIDENKLDDTLHAFSQKLTQFRPNQKVALKEKISQLESSIAKADVNNALQLCEEIIAKFDDKFSSVERTVVGKLLSDLSAGKQPDKSIVEQFVVVLLDKCN